MVLARLLQAADITATDHVLDVGCGTGYSSALLARLAGSVVALEEDKDLAAFARRVLRELAPQVEVVEGLLKTGWPAAGPYDAIVLNGAAEIIPEPLFAQLKDGGRLVGIEGEGPATQARIYCSIRGEISGRSITEAAAPLLPGFARPPEFVF
jgi:protein-L-isoaspartate(D-aspartate) O-methyltransferase